MATTKVTTGGITNATIKNEDIEADTIQFTKLQEMATSHIVGRSTSGTGNPEVLGAAQVRTILNVADGATASSGTTINNNADNRVITGSGTADTLEAESNLTYGGGNLQLTTAANGQQLLLKSTGNFYNKLSFDANRTSAGDTLGFIDFSWDTDKVADILGVAGSDTTNKDDGHIVFRTSPSQGSISERMRIDSSGKLLIGTTTSAAGSLVVKDTAGNQIWTVGRSSDGNASISFRNNADDAYNGRIAADDSTGMDFEVAGTQRMLIDRSGNVIIKNTGVTASTGLLQLNHTDGRKNTIGTHYASNAYDSRVEIGISDGSTSGGTNRVASFSYAGLSFGTDTASANRLDDYEEGTFTAYLYGTSGNPTQSYQTQNGYYIKIGRFVNVTVDILMAASGVSGGTGLAAVSIPFAQANLTNHQGVSASVGYAPSWGAITPTAAYASPNNTFLYLMGNDKDTGTNFVQASQIGNSTRLIMGFSYATN